MIEVFTPGCELKGLKLKFKKNISLNLTEF